MGQKKPRLTAEEQIRRAEEALERRIRQRMDREREAGTVFFTAPIETGFQELKLQGDRLTFLRPQGGEYAEDRGWLLRRLEQARWEEGRLRLRGEFWYQCGEGLRHVREKEARVVRTTLTVRRPLEHEEELRAFLDRAAVRASELPPTPLKERAGGLLRSVLTPFAAVGLAAVMLPGLIVQGLFTREVKGTLEGFDLRDGKHYPRYTYPLPDGTVLRRTDERLALEDAVAAEEAAALLRRKYPREVKVRCSRRRPEKSRCLYL